MLGYIVYYIEHLSERAIACISMHQTHYFKLFSFWLKTLGPWAWRANHTFYLDRHLMKLHYRGCKIPKYHRLSGWVEWVAQLFNQINQYFQPSAFTLKSFAWRESVQNGLSQFGSLLGLCLQLCLVCVDTIKIKTKEEDNEDFSLVDGNTFESQRSGAGSGAEEARSAITCQRSCSSPTYLYSQLVLYWNALKLVFCLKGVWVSSRSKFPWV